MWTCAHCGEEAPDNFDVCWKCGSGRDGSPPQTVAPGADDSDSGDGYGTLAALCTAAEILGIVWFAASAGTAIVFLLSLASSGPGVGFGGLALLFLVCISNAIGFLLGGTAGRILVETRAEIRRLADERHHPPGP